MKIIKRALSFILFVLIFVVIFSSLSNLFVHKELEGTWDSTRKVAGFYNEPEDEFDLMFFGSSNAYCFFNPLVLYEETSLKSYVFATQQQPIWATYHYIKDALKTQSPDLIVVDVMTLSKDDDSFDEGVRYSFMDNMPFSKNKIDLAFASAEKEEPLRLLFNFIKYHSRWSELTETDYTFKRNEETDFLKGYLYLEYVFKDATPPVLSGGESEPITEKCEMYFNKIVDLAKKEEIPLLFVKTPSNSTLEEAKKFEYVKTLAEDKGVPFIDFNYYYDEIGLIMTEDFFDKSHLNTAGAEKFTRYFATYLKDNFSITPREISKERETAWENDLQKYYDLKEKKES